MPADYTNPPLIEAICEFHFEAGQPWDWTIPGLIYARVQNHFPVKQEQPAIQIGLMAGQPVPLPSPSMSRMQFLRQDRSALIQIGPNFLSVNHLRPYQNWASFRDLIFGNLDIYTEIAQPQNVVRIGLRYLNKIEVPESPLEDNLSLNDYLLALPDVPQALLNNPIQSFIQRVEIFDVAAQGLMVLQSGSLPSEGTGDTSFLLDLDFVTTSAAPIPLDEVRPWITRAHDEIERAFEACIGDQARKTFGDKRHG